MSKIVYWIGVYSICVTIHKVVGATKWYLQDQNKKNSESDQEQRETIGIQPEKVRKPVNKIGFTIDAA